MKNSKSKFVVIAGLVLVACAAAVLGYRHFAHPGMPASHLAHATTYTSGPFHVTVGINPEVPTVGDNQLTVKVADDNGDPVTGAAIKACGEMAAMGAMQAMRAPADLEEVAPGLYAGPLKLAMSGAWPLSLTIQKQGVGTTRLGFDMATGRQGLNITAGGTPMASTMGSGTRNNSADKGNAQEASNEPAPSGVITVDAHRRQLIGVKTGKAVRKELVKTIRAVGQVDYNERNISNVSLKFDAWIGDLKADYVGVHVKRGQMLFTVYSPELLAAQQEYLETRQRLSRRGPGDSLLKAARKRLMLWDVSAAQVRALEHRGKPLEYLPIFAPKSGTVVAKMVDAGSHMNKGDTLLRIADLSTVWVDAEVYEADLPLVKEGMQASITLPYLPGAKYQAKVDYVYPTLQGKTRTARIRLVLNNPNGALKPNMYAQVELHADLGKRLVVPEEAVLIAGKARVVFKDIGEHGKLVPVHVKTGQRVDGYVEITDGLSAGDEVITSGNFLIAAEAKLKTGIEQW